MPTSRESTTAPGEVDEDAPLHSITSTPSLRRYSFMAMNRGVRAQKRHHFGRRVPRAYLDRVISTPKPASATLKSSAVSIPRQPSSTNTTPLNRPAARTSPQSFHQSASKPLEQKKDTSKSPAPSFSFQRSTQSADDSPFARKTPSSSSMLKFHNGTGEKSKVSPSTTRSTNMGTKFFFKPGSSTQATPTREDKKTTPTKMTQSTLGSSVTRIKPVTRTEDDRSIPVFNPKSEPESESDSSESTDEESSEEEVITKRERGKEMSAREKRRLEYDAAREQQLPQAAKVGETEQQASTRKKMNRELAQLTEWTDWIQETLDKKSEQEKQHAQQMQYQLTPPKKRQRKNLKHSAENSKNPGSSQKNISFNSPTIKLNLPKSSSVTPPPMSNQQSSQPSSRSSSQAYTQLATRTLAPIMPRPLSQSTMNFSKPLAHPHREPPISRTFSQTSHRIFVPQRVISSSSSTPINMSPAQPRQHVSSSTPAAYAVSPTPSVIVPPRASDPPTSRQAIQSSRPSQQYPRPLAPAPPKLSSMTSSSSSGNSSVSPPPYGLNRHNATKPFHEPSANEPIMSVTGLPLGAPPSARIKKESLWPKKRPMKRKNNRRKRGDSADTDSADETSPEAEGADPDVLERELSERLVTQINEQLQRQSEIRSSLAMHPLASDEPTVFENRYPRELGPDDQDHTPQKRGRGRPPREDKRKIKNASPKKNRENPFGYDNPLQLAGEKRGTAFDFSDTTKDNDDYCYSCGEPGIFLCCESCPKSFHFACCDPPFEESNLPDDEWFCNQCYAKRHPPIPNKPGLFSKLLDQVERRNPTQFRLPKNIRERFEGVSTGEYGEYEDTGYKPYKAARGAFEQTAPEHHYDKNGQPLLCVKCGKSGITPDKLMGDVDKPIITCEYCPSSWHLDCLNPPLATIKQLGKKWKCPNHADGLFEQRRRVKNPTIIDVDLPRGFRNDGNVDIMLESDESDSDTDTTVLPSLPEFDAHDTPDGVAAVPCKTQRKLWKDDFAIFRLPERGVVLDFMGKIHEHKEAVRNAKIDEYYRIARENQLLLKKLASEDNDAEKHAIVSLVELKENEFKELADVAAKALGAEDETKDADDQDQDLGDGTPLTSEQVQELLQIKRLMSLKGKEKLMKFLKSPA